jgi:hypothetical protein
MRVLFLLSGGHSQHILISLIRSGLFFSVWFAMASQGTAYIATHKYSSMSSFDFYISLYCLLGYLLFLYSFSRCIHICGQLLESTGSSSVPLSSGHSHRRTRRSRGRSTKANEPPHYISSHPINTSNDVTKPESTSTLTDDYESASPFHIPYYKVLHLCHFGSHFETLVQQCPEIMSLLGPSSMNILTPSSNSSSTSTTNDFAFISDDQHFNLTNITKIPQPESFIRFQTVYSINNGDYPIIFDTGASITITPFKEDFITFNEDNGKSHLQGITGSTVCRGKGIIELSVIADDGSSRIINTNALYVPAATVRLLSVQSYCKEKNDGSQFIVTGKACHFQFPTSIGGGKISFDLQSDGNLPRTSASRQLKRSFSSNESNKSFTVIHDDNMNLSRGQKHLLHWHWRLGHASMAWIQYLF